MNHDSEIMMARLRHGISQRKIIVIIMFEQFERWISFRPKPKSQIQFIVFPLVFGIGGAIPSANCRARKNQPAQHLKMTLQFILSVSMRPRMRCSGN